MPPRRKQADEEAPTMPEDGTAEAPAESKPKKKRAARAKKPAGSASEPAEERIPAIIPIKTAPPVQRLKIEPDIHVAEEEPWRPSFGDAVSKPRTPAVLPERRVSREEVADLLRAGGDDEDDRLDRFRPPVRTGAFRKIALGFAVLALLVGAGVAYAVYARATVSVYPQKAEVKTERVLAVSADPKGDDAIPGEVAEVTVSGEKAGAPLSSTKADGVASGFVTLINETVNPQTLVATTRLLAADGTLFRLKARVNVPANGRLKAEAYADQPGESGNIGPTNFTIPGLNATLQKSIYGQSDAPMTGGVVTVGTVSAGDIENIENALRQELIAQARRELGKSEKSWTGQAVSAETMSRTVSAGPGEKVNSLVVRLTLRVRAVRFDRAKAIDAAAEELRRSLTSERELLGIDPENNVFFSIDKADSKSGTASLRVALSGQSVVSLQSPLFDAAKLRGLGLEEVRRYFEGIEGVEQVEVKFRPFWLKRMPLLPDQIEFQIEK